MANHACMAAFSGYVSYYAVKQINCPGVTDTVVQERFQQDKIMFVIHIVYSVSYIISDFLSPKWEAQAYLQVFLRFAPMILYLGAYLNIQFMQFVDAYDEEGWTTVCFEESESNQ